MKYIHQQIARLRYYVIHDYIASNMSMKQIADKYLLTEKYVSNTITDGLTIMKSPGTWPAGIMKVKGNKEQKISILESTKAPQIFIPFDCVKMIDSPNTIHKYCDLLAQQEHATGSNDQIARAHHIRSRIMIDTTFTLYALTTLPPTQYGSNDREFFSKMVKHINQVTTPDALYQNGHLGSFPNITAMKQWAIDKLKIRLPFYATDLASNLKLIHMPI